MNSRAAYYVGFPLVIFGLCAFAYYLGFTRGRQSAVSAPTAQEKIATVEAHQKAEELTFFKTLKEDAPPVPRLSTPKPSPESTRTTPPAIRSTAPISMAEEPVEAKSTSSGKFSIQISAFKDIGKAHELIDELKNAGYAAFTKPIEVKGLHRVFVGPFETKEKAEAAQSELHKKGFQKGFLTRT